MVEELSNLHCNHMELAVVAAHHILRHILDLGGHSLVEEGNQVVAALASRIVGGSRCSDAVHRR